MAPRAHWKGYLKLSLVSCPIALYPAVSAAERISFRQVNKQTGHRLRQQLVDSVTGEVVKSHDKGRGYEIAEQQFLLVQDEELEAARQEARKRPAGPASINKAAPLTEGPETSRATARRSEARRLEAVREEQPAEVTPPPAPVRVESTRTIEIERFIPRAQIDARYHDTPYYVAPRDEIGQEAFAVIREAMHGQEVVGLGRVVLAKRERPFIIQPLGKGICGTTLRYAHEIKNEAEYFDRIPDLTLPDDLLEIAERILESKMADFDPAFIEDRYRSVLVSMLKEKQAKLPVKTLQATKPSSRNVINLMDALKRSLETERSVFTPKPLAKSTSRREVKSTLKRSAAKPRKTG